jgi:fermentation-respiration switch protein FrsA (DUF1100 family)
VKLKGKMAQGLQFQPLCKDFPLNTLPLRHAVARVLRALILFYGLTAISLFACQRQVEYQPGYANPDPASLGLKGVQVQTLHTPDHESLVLWYAPARRGQPTVLFFQGNAGDLTQRAPRLAYYQARGFGAAFLSYRGFGGSSGKVTEAGLITDARTAYGWLAGRTAPDRIVLVGESLGTGVAVQLAALVPVGAVALDAPYASALSVAQRRFPLLPVALLMKDQFLSVDHVAAIHAPLLIQHGTADDVVPFASGQALYAAALTPKTFLPLPGRGHEIIFAPDVWAREVDFFTRVIK